MVLMNNKASVSQLLKPHEVTNLKYVSRPLLDIGAAADRLGCSERFVRRLVQERRIPFVKLGGTRVRFVDVDLDTWVEGQRVEQKR
jgi:excisionase family DNA binding protein